MGGPLSDLDHRKRVTHAAPATIDWKLDTISNLARNLPLPNFFSSNLDELQNQSDETSMQNERGNERVSQVSSYNN